MISDKRESFPKYIRKEMVTVTKAKLKMSNKRFIAITTPILAILLVLIIVATTVLNSMPYFLDTYLGRGTRTVTAAEGADQWDTKYYNAPYGTWLDSSDNENSRAKSREAAQQVALEIAKEGIVLLKNDGALPLAGGANITAFGRAYVDPVYGGTGSGGVPTKYNITAVDAMNRVYKVNPSVTEAMQAALAGTPRGSITTDKYLASSYYIGEFEKAVYEGASYDGYTNAAVVFIGRTGGEGVDMPHDLKKTLSDHAANGGNFTANAETDRYEDGQHYLELNAEEKEMIDLAAEKCDKVIVVLNTSNPMEVGYLADNDKVDAILWIGGPGAMGFEAMTSIMTGETNPSGRLPDTFYADFTKSPVWNNFGRSIYTNVRNLEDPGVDTSKYVLPYDADMSAAFVEYEEGIYMGYRYYETMYELLGSKGEAWYSDWKNTADKASGTGVVYPFGYGLAYTQFKQEIVGFETSGDNISITVKVTNTGNKAGKDVVQIYYGAEYTDFDKENKIEKASKNLVDFAKTKLLKAGQSEEVVVTFPKEEMASYCYTHDNGDGTKGSYVLGKGDFTIYVGKDSHANWGSKVWHNNDTIWYNGENLRASEKNAQSVLDQQGEPINIAATGEYRAASNLFEESTKYMTSGARNMLTRASGFTQWEATTPTGDELIASDEIKNALLSLPYADPANYTDPSIKAPRLNEDNGLSVVDMRGKDYNDPMWEDLLAQLTVKDLDDISKPSNYSNIEIQSIGLERMQDSDGPQGIKGAYGSDGWGDTEANCAWPTAPVVAATFNTELIKEMGDAIGTEALTVGVTGWYAPAMNIHRSPFGGRCFEYYSEDGVLSGKMAAATVSGAASQGVVVYIKHFVLNDQETDRCSNDTEQHTSLIGGGCVWADEQTMREIYFKPFEICIKEAMCDLKYIADDKGTVETRTIRATLGLMSSFNRIGTVWAGGDSRLLTDLLRNEWGFQGTIVTDMAFYAHMNPLAMYFAGGNDNLGHFMSFGKMHRNSLGPIEIDTSNPTIQRLIVDSVHRMAYAAVNSMPYYAIAPGTVTTYSISPWQIWLTIANVAVYAIIAAGVVWIILRLRDEKKHPEHYKHKEQV